MKIANLITIKMLDLSKQLSDLIKDDIADYISVSTFSGVFFTYDTLNSLLQEDYFDEPLAIEVSNELQQITSKMKIASAEFLFLN